MSRPVPQAHRSVLLHRRPVEKSWRRTWSAGLAFALCLSTSCVEQASERQRLVLNEVSSHPLPEQFNLVGLSSSEDDQIVIWGREPNVVLRFNKTFVSDGEWLLPANVPPLSVWADVDRIEVVTSNPPAIHVFRDGETSGGSQPIAIDGAVREAARGREGWYVLWESPRTGALTVRFPGEGESRVAPPYGGLTVDDRERVWLTEIRSPFSIYDLTDDDEASAVMQPETRTLESLLAESGAKDASNWASVPVVVVEGGFIQTLADLASDRRIFIVYGPDGQPLSATPLGVPLGFVDSTKSPPRIYGARRTNILEIVEYAYGWYDEDLRIGGMPDAY